jgi:hypothetical protein
MSIEFEAWVDRARHSPIEAEIDRRGIPLRRVGAERVGPCPRCGGTDRFSINPVLGVWNCRQCKPATIAGDVIGLVQFLDDTDFIHAVELLNHEPPPLNGSGPDPGAANDHVVKIEPRIVAIYGYVDETAKLLYQVVRYDPKGFRQRQPREGGGWEWSLRGVRLVLFMLPELIEAIACERQVFVVEGEKDVLTLTARGMVATCNSGGAGKWREEFNGFFRDADVVIIADRDPQAVNAKTGEKLFHPDGRPRHPGLDHALHIAEQLKPVAASVRMFEISALWPACGEKGDITDYFESRGTVEALNDFVTKRESWSPGQTKPKGATIPIIQAFPIDGSLLPRRPWLVPGLLMRRQVTVIIAPPGSGKSLLTLQLAMVCSSGNGAWSNWYPRGPYRTLIINVEEDADEMKRRLFGAAVKMNISQDRLSGVYLAQATSIVVAKADSRTKTVTATPILEEIVQTILREQIDIVVVDPFAETFAGDENSNSELKWAGVLWREVARRTNAAVFLVHHAKKYAQHMAGDPDAGRGGGSLTGIARIVATLFTMTEAEAEIAGVPNDERSRYIRFDDAKANLSLLIQGARWFEKQSVGIGNAGDGLPEDEVGVLVPWAPPDIIAGMTVVQANGILDQLRDGIRGDDGQPIGDPFCLSRKGGAKRWAGTVIQEALQCDDAAAKRLLAAWRKSGLVSEYQAATSTSKGAMRGCLRVNDSMRPGDVEEWR